MKREKQQKGFTLLEILLVIAAIGILAAIVLIAINPNRQLAQARNAQRRSDINSVYKSLEQHLINTGSYPIGTINGVLTPINNIYVDICSSTSPNITCLNLNSLLTPEYLAVIPRDPQALVGSSGYQVALNPANNRVSVRASNAEMSQTIIINPFAVSWSPLAISPALWLDANDTSTITQSSGNISQWTDKSGNNRNATQTTAINQPQILANAINGLSAANWGVTQGPKSIGNSSAGIVVKDVFIVGKFEGSALNNFPGLFNPFSGPTIVGITGFPTTTYFYTYLENNNYYFTNYYFNASSSTSNSNVFPTVASPFVLRAEATRTDNNNWTGYAVGMDRDYNGLNRSWTGLIGEVLVFSSTPTLSDRQKIEGYLAHKWGLTSLLPGAHPYKTVAPTQ